LSLGLVVRSLSLWHLAVLSVLLFCNVFVGSGDTDDVVIECPVCMEQIQDGIELHPARPGEATHVICGQCAKSAFFNHRPCDMTEYIGACRQLMFATERFYSEWSERSVEMVKKYELCRQQAYLNVCESCIKRVNSRFDGRCEKCQHCLRQCPICRCALSWNTLDRVLNYRTPAQEREYQLRRAAEEAAAKAAYCKMRTRTLGGMAVLGLVVVVISYISKKRREASLKRMRKRMSTLNQQATSPVGA